MFSFKTLCMLRVVIINLYTVTPESYVITRVKYRVKKTAEGRKVEEDKRLSRGDHQGHWNRTKKNRS